LDPKKNLDCWIMHGFNLLVTGLIIFNKIIIFFYEISIL
jgi:hypothetical protein